MEYDLSEQPIPSFWSSSDFSNSYILPGLSKSIFLGGNKEGIYTVKSGYHQVKFWEHISVSNSSNFSGSMKHWKKLWRLRILPKQMYLLRRILNRAVPVRAKLRSRGVQCRFCVLDVKGVLNPLIILSKTVWATQVWFSSPLGIKFDNHSSESFSVWLQLFITKAPVESVELAASVTYSIWWARIKCVSKENKFRSWIQFQKLVKRSRNTSINVC